jgi:putative ABC transport system permease protein
MQPPRLPEKIIQWLCRQTLAEEILGDLYEQFQDKETQKGKLVAQAHYWLNTIKFINGRTLKGHHKLNRNAMLSNYIIIAFRNLTKQKTYSAINIGGLAIGIACSILLGLYIHSELSFDHFHENAGLIVKANMEYDMGDGIDGVVRLTPTALLPAMQETIPEVETGVRIYYPAIFKPVLVSFGSRAFQEKGFCYADEGFFKMFSFDLIEGNKNAVLSEPNNIVLSESSKIKYFGDDPAVGQTLVVDGKSFQVTGVMKDIPANSSIQCDFVASFSSYWQKEPIWFSANFLTFIELNRPIEGKILSAKIQAELQKLGVSVPEDNRYFGFKFIPLLEMHLYSEVDEGGDINMIYVFGSIALLILLIAIINYANLATARSFYRAKEVALRKSLGAVKSNIIFQLLGESFVTSFLAIIIALLLVFWMLPIFKIVSGSAILPDALFQLPVIWSLILMYIVISLSAGIYPALKMSKFNPVDIIKGRYHSTSEGSILRKSLIVVQFFISLTLIIATIIIYKQLSFINDKPLGYNKDNILVIPVTNAILEKEIEFKNIALQNALIKSISIIGETPPNIQGGYSVELPGGKSLGVVAVAIDDSYIQTVQIKLIAGRSINRQDLTRTREEKKYSFMANQSAVKLLGWQPSEAVGQTINLNGRTGIIQGVVSDFHFRALYEEVAPLILFSEQTWAYNYVMISIDDADIPAAVAAVEQSWRTIDAETPLSFNFLEQEFADLHINADRSSKLLTSFAGLAILIASLGLLGIVSFSMAQRSKEIGVRKVLGASVFNVLVLANKEFLMLILVAFLLAIPFTYWFMNQWLVSFAYHVDIGWWPMGLGLILTMFVAVCTISFESLKAALVNPADTLRSE